MKESIAIFYIGLPRFRSTTQENHRQFFELLKEKYSCNFYDFTTTGKRENCPYDPEEITHRGPLQVWDFANAINKVKEDIMIKFRTDILLTPSSEITILSELKKIINRNIDVSFLGHSIKNDYAERYKIVPAGNGVGDLMIIADKNRLKSTKDIMNELKDKEPIRSGNRVYPIIVKDLKRANNIACQLYILRKDYDINFDWEWQACLDYLLSRTPKKSKNALQWFNNHTKKFKDL